MSSFVASANLSTETTNSSLLRSGLNISVGDTKSIVLALQALQGKIRALEQDRDLHRDQYERILQAHEAYKIDMEHQLERERAVHRRREEELQELLQKAQDERSRIQGTLSGSQGDLTTFRKEIEAMIESDKNMATQRELKLQTEITRLQQEISEEKARYHTLLNNVEMLKGERSAIEEMNLNLRDAIHELQNQRHHTQRQQQPARIPNTRRGRLPGVSSAASKGFTAYNKRDCLYRCSGYREPTCNSLLRDARNAFEEGFCICGKAYPTVDSPVNTPRNNPTFAGGLSQRQGRSTSIHSRVRIISRDTSVLPTHPLSYRKPSPSRSVHTQGPVQHYSTDSVNLTSVSPSYHHNLTTSKGDSKGNISIDEVEKQLDEELEELQKEYQNTISRAKIEKFPRHVVNDTLKQISSHINRKMEQVDLLRAARREIGPPRTLNANSNDINPDHGIADKQVQRNRLVNELRYMLAQSAERQ
ncbi:unnamed protein product [Phytomonas sp. Hart1]|nr:unnamed protein product [Phytomonas sp. Hart1]|eukprot:CCW67001.1 unnamed protein product [Phytomonas sp. isolate Hart1]